jgi:hypothetical protein
MNAFDNMPPLPPVEAYLGSFEQSKPVKTVKVIPTAWAMPEHVPPREWVYGRALCRQIVSGIVSPGGVGKSSMAMVDALAMVTGRKLLHHWVPNGDGYRVWYWCGEDPMDELHRRLMAACLHYGIGADDIGSRLFVDSGREQPIEIAAIGEGGMAVATPVKDVLIEQMKQRKIDVLVIDPFVTCHAVSENSNEQINVVVSAWRDVAHHANAAIELVHHANKAGSGDSIKDGRGASAFADGIRGGRVLAPLSFEDGEKMGLTPEETSRITRVMNGAKPNMQPRGIHASYFKMVSVPLNNGNDAYPDGDEIGVATDWQPPDAFDGVKLDDLAKVQDAISTADHAPASNPNNSNWAGYIVAEVLDHDIGDPKSTKAERTTEQNQARYRVSSLLKQWIKSKSLERVDVYSDRDGRNVPSIRVGVSATALTALDCRTTAETAELSGSRV